MAANAEPGVADQAPLVLRQPLHRHEPAPGHDPGELGPAVAEHLLPDRRVNAVGANQHVTSCGLAIREADRRAVVFLVEPHAGVAGMDRIRVGIAHRIQQYRMEIAAMGGPVRCAKSLQGGLTEVE